MKIEFDVPEWVIGKHIYIFAGAELLGIKEVKIVHENGKHVTKYLPLKIKPNEGRCNGCGVCCEGCSSLSQDGCSLKAEIPFKCIRSICTHIEECSERLEEVK